jgi:acyl-coenzyme A thioesterase PaaI-like protein
MRPHEWLAGDAHARQRYAAAVPLAAALRIALTVAAPARAAMRLPWQDALAGPGARGALAVLLDSACGAAVMCALDEPRAFATLSLRMEYPASVPAGRALRARARCLHLDAEIAHVTAVARAGSTVVARARGTFALVPGREPLHRYGPRV